MRDRHLGVASPIVWGQHYEQQLHQQQSSKDEADERKQHAQSELTGEVNSSEAESFQLWLSSDPMAYSMNGESYGSKQNEQKPQERDKEKHKESQQQSYVDSEWNPSEFEFSCVEEAGGKSTTVE